MEGFVIREVELPVCVSVCVCIYVCMYGVCGICVWYACVCMWIHD